MTNHSGQLVFAAVILASAVTAHGETTLERMDGWPYAGARAVAIDAERDLAYLSSGGAILVLDVSSPAEPSLLHDGLHTEGHVRDLRYASEDQRLYIADWSGGLEIWDLADPQAPARMSALPVYYIGTDSDQPTNNLDIVGDFLYINATEARVHAFNVSDPTNPVDLGVQAGPLWYPPYYERETNDVAVGGEYVYVAGDGIAKFFIHGDGTLTKVGEYLNSYGISCIDIQGAFAYAGMYGEFGIFDVSYSYPEMVGSVPVTDGLTDLTVSGDFVFGVNESGLHVFDVSDPYQPQEIATLAPPEGYRIRLTDNTVYITTDNTGLQVVDVSDELHPVLIGTYDTVGTTSSVVLAGQHAFLGQSTDGLVITDVSDADAVEVMGHYDEHTAADSLLIGDYLYITDWFTRALRILDVSDLTDPVEVGSIEDFYAVSLNTDGTYLFVMRFSVETQLFYLHVFGLEDPTAPVQLSTITVAPLILEVEYANGHLFAVEFFDEGLHIIDVADPHNPHEVGFYPVGWGEDISIEGNRAYVASFHEGLLVLDIIDPANPVEIGGIHEVFQFDSVAVSGSRLYATTGLSTNVLHLYDASDPSSIVELDSIELPGDVWDLKASGSYAYVVGGHTGLQIIRAGGVSGDIDGDGDVDISDLLLLLASWGDCPEPPAGCPADLNADGVVNVLDLLLVLANWT